MKNKFFILFLMLVLTIPMVTFIDTQTVVKADEPAPEFDYDYIFEITENLSGIIDQYKDYNLDKGRMFATEGERQAAIYLADEMDKIGLYDPTDYSQFPYREPITNIASLKLIVC